MPLPSVFQLLFSTVHFHHGEPRQSQTPHSKNKKCENRVFTDNTCSYFLFIPNIWLVIRITTTTLRAAERWIPLWEMPSGPALLLTASVVKTGVIGLLLPQHIPDCHYWCEIRALLWSDRSYHCEWSAQAHCENNTVVTHFNKGSEFNWWDNVRDGGGVRHCFKPLRNQKDMKVGQLERCPTAVTCLLRERRPRIDNKMMIKVTTIHAVMIRESRRSAHTLQVEDSVTDVPQPVGASAIIGWLQGFLFPPPTPAAFNLPPPTGGKSSCRTHWSFICPPDQGVTGTNRTLRMVL